MPPARDPHQPLRDDVHLLGELLGEMVRAKHGADLFARIEEVRALAKQAGAGDAAAFERLGDLLRSMPLDQAVPVARAFAQFLALANVAEQHHRVRRRREHAREGQGRPQPGSCDETFARLRTSGVEAAALAHAVEALRIELVLTAHPTEIVRRTVLQIQRRIAAALALRDRPDLTPAERDDASLALRREIATAWDTDEVRGQQVTPLDEVRAGLVVFEQTIWDAVPTYLRALDRALSAETGRRLPLDAAPLRFGSWIGGDRDGNPTVTPDVTRRATWLARWMAADLYLREVAALRAELSLTTASGELRSAVPDAPEPYRAVLRPVVERLRATRAWADIHSRESPPSPANGTRPYLDVADLAAPLRLCHRSLTATGNEHVAAGRLTDILRRIATFGLTLARLDLRQEAARHAEAIDWIAATRGLGRYVDAPEDERLALLVAHLSSGTMRFVDLPIDAAPAAVRDVIDTFRTAATLQPDSLGAYVITMTSAASDVLAVEWLQQLAGGAHPQRVVALFETAADLDHAGAVVGALLRIPWYRNRLGPDGIEVMVGYSDSAKDAGRLAAAWALYRAQEEIVAACARHGIPVTIFHGRGGSIGRGGGPTYLAAQSQPPGSVNGRLRVTEQGEVIQTHFLLSEIAVRTLEVYTTATLEATLTPASPPRNEWRAAMDRLFTDARAAYRRVVYEEPSFVEYFRTATPEPELRAIHIGSRPARRGGGEGVASLRAIPWQFAWTQTRLLLASWLGIEGALAGAAARGDAPLLREMYERWPFFRSTLELLEMVLAKTDGRIAAEYDQRLVPARLQPLGRELRGRLSQAIAAVLDVTAHRQLAETNRVLRRAIDVRNPYVDPINLVQIEILDRLRHDDGRDAARSRELMRAFIVTVNGIAAGMRNTG
jgi:phosphoenolpyruvate carboxylase